MKPKELGKGDPCTISGDPADMGLNERSGVPGGNSAKLRGETTIMKQQPTILKSSISSDRGTFKCK